MAKCHACTGIDFALFRGSIGVCEGSGVSGGTGVPGRSLGVREGPREGPWELSGRSLGGRGSPRACSGNGQKVRGLSWGSIGIPSEAQTSRQRSSMNVSVGAMGSLRNIKNHRFSLHLDVRGGGPR